MQQLFSSVWDKSRDPGANWGKLEHMYTTLDIHARLIETFPNCKIPLRETAGNGTVASKKAKTTYLDEGAHFILQLHDELYYEVKRELK